MPEPMLLFFFKDEKQYKGGSSPDQLSDHWIEPNQLEVIADSQTALASIHQRDLRERSSSRITMADGISAHYQLCEQALAYAKREGAEFVTFDEHGPDGAVIKNEVVPYVQKPNDPTKIFAVAEATLLRRKPT